LPTYGLSPSERPWDMGYGFAYEFTAYQPGRQKIAWVTRELTVLVEKAQGVSNFQLVDAIYS